MNDQITFPESRAKAVEARTKNLTPLFELNKLIQRKSKIQTQLLKLNTEISEVQSGINKILVTIGANNPVSVNRIDILGRVYEGGLREKLVNYLKSQAESKPCSDIARAIGCKYQNTRQGLAFAKDIFVQDSNKNWSLVNK